MRRFLKEREVVRKGDWIVHRDCKEPITKEMVGKTVAQCREGQPFADSWQIARWDKAPDMSKPEPDPNKNNHPPIWPMVVKDMEDRDFSGYCKYGTRLQPFNRRDALTDLYQEQLDAIVYTRQFIEEMEWVGAELRAIQSELGDTQLTARIAAVLERIPAFREK